MPNKESPVYLDAARRTPGPKPATGSLTGIGEGPRRPHVCKSCAALHGLALAVLFATAMHRELVNALSGQTGAIISLTAGALLYLALNYYRDRATQADLREDP